MEKLRTEFTGTGEVRGLFFKQVESNGYAFIYEVKHPMVYETYYEVFARRISSVTGNEEYPPRSEFGVSAFCCIDYDKAHEIYLELSKSIKERNDNELADQ